MTPSIRGGYQFLNALAGLGSTKRVPTENSCRSTIKLSNDEDDERWDGVLYFSLALP